MAIIDKSAAELEISKPQKIRRYLTPDKNDGQITMGMSTWEPDSSGEPHSHDNWDEHFFILEGEGKMLIGDEVYQVKEDMAIKIPRNVKHTVVDSGKQGLKMIFVLSHYK